MNSNPLNNSNDNDNIYYISKNTSNLNYPAIDPSLQYQIENQENPKNIQYFPIATGGSVSGENTIYLAAEDNQISNDYIPKFENNYSNENNYQKNEKRNALILPQRSIGLQIKKAKFEYLLNFSDKKEKENKKENRINPIEEEKKNNQYKNLKNDFLSTARELIERSQNKKRKELSHSYSTENYSDILNKSISLYNLTRLENSKIMDENFINGMRDSKRKDNLMRAIEKYKRFKSLGKKNVNNLNNSFTLGYDHNKYRQKSIERIYRMKNNYNIIEEDENENSDNDTIKKKTDSVKCDEIKNNKNEISNKNNNNERDNNKNNDEEKIKVIENDDK
jgi:hypothetical protein